jgi:hypothetical protein
LITGTGLRQERIAQSSMLQIEPDQLAALQEKRDQRFEDRLCVHARTHFPERCQRLDDDALHQAARMVMREARGMGITSELGIALFFNVAVCFGVNFPRNADIRWAFPITPHPDESVDPGWITRVSEIAVETLKRKGAVNG